MTGMPVPRRDAACGASATVDSGPRVDVEELRKTHREFFVPLVHVEGAYAMLEWYGAGGGQAVYKRDGSTWKVIAGGGGAMDADNLAAHGVPHAVRCRFGDFSIRESGCATSERS